MKRFSALLLAMLLALCLTACGPDPLATPAGNIDRGNYATGVTQNAGQPGKWDSGFDIHIENDSHPVGLLLRGTSTRGRVFLAVTDLEGKVVWQSSPQSGSILIRETLTSLPKGDYQLVVTWDEPLTASFDLYMVPGETVLIPEVQPTALVSGIGMMLVAIGFLAYAGIRRLGWGIIALGALSWVVTVAVKFLIAIPLNPIVYDLLVTPGSPGIGDWVFYLYVGTLTGITEILMVWILLRATRLGKGSPGSASWNQALGFGIGFGAVEALLLGLSSFASILTALVAPTQIPLSALSTLATGNHILVGFAAVWERFFTIWVHVLSNVLLFYGARTRNGVYFWLAFWFKSGLDTAAAYAQLTGTNSLAKMWLIEAIVAIFGLVGYWGIRKIKPLFFTPAEGFTAVEKLSSE